MMNCWMICLLLDDLSCILYFLDGLLVVLGFNATLTAVIMVVGDAHVFPGFLTPVL